VRLWLRGRRDILAMRKSREFSTESQPKRNMSFCASASTSSVKEERCLAPRLPFRQLGACLARLPVCIKAFADRGCSRSALPHGRAITRSGRRPSLRPRRRQRPANHDRDEDDWHSEGQPGAAGKGNITVKKWGVSQAELNLLTLDGSSWSGSPSGGGEWLLSALPRRLLTGLPGTWY
jgi:hypothetical protein